MYGAPVGTIILTGGTTATGYLISQVNNTTGVTTYNGTRIFHITLVSATTGSTFQVLNGQNGPVELLVNGSSNMVIETDYGFHGQAFSSGAYVVTDANMVRATIVCRSDIF